MPADRFTSNFFGNENATITSITAGATPASSIAMSCRLSMGKCAFVSNSSASSALGATFELASVSKQFTGMATLLLDTAGGNALAEPLRLRFLPEADARALQARLGREIARNTLRW